MIVEKFNFKNFIVVTLLVSIWINVSEVFRYFVFVIPRIKSYFPNKLGIADMDLKIFAIWGFWDTILTASLVFIYWLYSRVFGNSNRSVLISGTFTWLVIFVIFWIANANMGLSEWQILMITLPLSWLEMIVGNWIAFKLYKKYENG